MSVRKIAGRGREELELDLGRDVKLTLIRIKAGSFMMGSPDDELGKGVNENETMHPVTLTRDYWLGKVPVTRIPGGPRRLLPQCPRQVPFREPRLFRPGGTRRYRIPSRPGPGEVTAVADR